ncbi:hypothetical protein OOT46_00480 [Aquabacterium sp. A7-Y]|uniref:hypothetical protein n=1 Tax=Aquabacterium sp. A7-Y TaxID=1349605 RepID=UPI00223D8481|nr:hypothetical protein [Aquabacterium sp. A7-Y]MCW7536329.1 hypothetical protein [Aquabacterium sp. A7-Y]
MRRHLMSAFFWIAAVCGAHAQTSPGSLPGSRPAPDTLPPPVTQPDAVRQAGGNEAERSQPKLSSTERAETQAPTALSHCTSRPRESRADCVRQVLDLDERAERDSGAARDGGSGMNPPRERGMSLPR